MKRKIALLSAAMCLLLPVEAFATEFGVGAGVGTPGISIEGKAAVSENIVVRGSFSYLDYGLDEEIDGIEYDGDLKLSNFGGFVDFHPFANGFNVSGGAFVGDKTLDIEATPATNVDIGGQTFTPAEVGTLVGDVQVNDFAPYLGLGYDNFLTSENMSFNVRLGVMFTGSPEATLESAGGTLSSDPILRAEIEEEIQNLEDDADDFKLFPVVSVGFAKKF